jgi:hypothetical protein
VRCPDLRWRAGDPEGAWSRRGRPAVPLSSGLWQRSWPLSTRPLRGRACRSILRCWSSSADVSHTDSRQTSVRHAEAAVATPAVKGIASSFEGSIASPCSRAADGRRCTRRAASSGGVERASLVQFLFRKEIGSIPDAFGKTERLWFDRKTPPNRRALPPRRR